MLHRAMAKTIPKKLPKLSRVQLNLMRKRVEKLYPKVPAKQRKVAEVVKKHGLEGAVSLVGYWDKLPSGMCGLSPTSDVKVCHVDMVL
jgi:hypothetical protein